MEDLNFPIVAAVCVYPTFLKTVRDTLDRLATSSSRKVEIAVVSTGFPTGQCGSLSLRCQEIEWAVENLATEVDVVILRSLVIQGKWRELYEEIAAMRKACGQNVKLKVIVEVGELGSLENVFKASMVAMNAGADFIKTSTGEF